MRFRRHKLLLSLVYYHRQYCEACIGRTRLMKYAFLLGSEYVDRVGHPYSFVPYRYGPFSFVAYRDLQKLADEGILKVRSSDSDDELGLADVEPAREAVTSLSAAEQDAARGIVAQYHALTISGLLAKVYARYPWYAGRTERTDLLRTSPPPIPRAKRGIYTAGYQGISIDGFMDFLMRTGIKHVLDIRRDAVSRKYGFSKNSLKNICSRLGLEYGHFPSLGIGRADRNAAHESGDYRSLFSRYRRSVRSEATALSSIQQEIQASPSVLLCAEADPHHCHRRILAELISDDLGMKVTHLSPQ